MMMSAETSRELWRAAFEVASQAHDLASEERESFIAGACGGKSELEERVAQLLDSRPNEAVDTGTVQGADEWTGREIAGHRLIRRIGVGGMGVVFEAQQDNPRRRVALKLLQTNTFSEEARRRFGLEVKLLGGLNHPNIATLYEAGEVDAPDGAKLFYYTMELVAGATDIVAYAERHGLSVRDRMRLFVETCRAIEHGHERQIIHRDLKPGNVLVDDDGHLRVIDYGIARSLDAEPWTYAPQTHSGAIIGTLGYMAPEQLAAERDAIGVRTDIYALGLVLYELLTGQPAFDLHGASLVESLDRVRSGSIPAVSSQVPELPREVDWIVAKCTEKNRERRYASVGAIVIDVKRFLDGETLGRPAPRRRVVLRSVMGGAVLLLAMFILGRQLNMGVGQAPEPGPEDESGSQSQYSQLAEYAATHIEAYERKISLPNPDADLQRRIDSLIVPSVHVPVTRDVREAFAAIPEIAEAGLLMRWDSAALREASLADDQFGLDLAYPACLTDILDLLLDETYDDLGWVVMDGRILVSDREGLLGKMELVIHPVRDLLSITPGVPIDRLRLLDELEVGGGPFQGVMMSPYEARMDDIAKHIEENVGWYTWELSGPRIDVGAGSVMVFQSADIQIEVESFLTAWRRSFFVQDGPRSEEWGSHSTARSVRQEGLASRRDELQEALAASDLPDLSFSPGNLVRPADLARELQVKFDLNVFLSSGLEESLQDTPDLTWFVDYHDMTALEFLNELPYPWSIRGGLVILGKGGRWGGSIGRIYNVSQLLAPSPGRFDPPSGNRASGLSRDDDEPEPETAIVTGDILMEMISDFIEPESWTGWPENSIQFLGVGRLIIIQSPFGHRAIGALLDKFEQELADRAASMRWITEPE